MSIESETCCTLYQAGDLSSGIILSQLRQFKQIHIALHDLIFSHFCSMDVENLQATMFIWKTNLHVHLKTARTKEGFVYHVKSVGHANNKNVVQLIDTIHLYKQ